MRAAVTMSALLLALLAGWLVVGENRASLESVNGVGRLIAAVNAGEIETASSYFAPDAVATVKNTRQIFDNAEEIGRFLEGLHRPGRTYEIVEMDLAGDRATLRVDIADRGHVWGQHKMVVVLRGGRIQSLDIVETRLTLWRIND